MLKKSLTALIVSLGLALSLSVGAQEATAPSPATTNPFDPSAWMSGQQAGASFNWFDPASMGADISGQAPGMGIPQFNLANPGGWSVFMNPGTYAAMMNPATYGQFMTPQFYMQFMDPNNWMSWMNPAAYGPWMNPSTYMQSMNPMAYMQFMNPGTAVAGYTVTCLAFLLQVPDKQTRYVCRMRFLQHVQVLPAHGMRFIRTLEYLFPAPVNVRVQQWVFDSDQNRLPCVGRGLVALVDSAIDKSCQAAVLRQRLATLSMPGQQQRIVVA